MLLKLITLITIFGLSLNNKTQANSDLRQELEHLKTWSEGEKTQGNIVAKNRQQWQQLERFTAQSKANDTQNEIARAAEEVTEDEISSRLSGVQKTLPETPSAPSDKKRLRKRSHTIQ
jgi:hypothetical protein